MLPHEYLAKILKQIDAVMLDPVEIDLNREMRRREMEAEADARAMTYYDDEMQSFLNSAPDIVEAMGEQSEDFLKSLLKHPEILEACKTYFHPIVLKICRERVS